MGWHGALEYSVRRSYLFFSLCSSLFDIETDTCMFSSSSIARYFHCIESLVTWPSVLQPMGAINSSSLPSIPLESPDKKKVVAHQDPVGGQDNQDKPIEAVSPARKRRQRSQKGSSRRQSKKAHRSPKAREGISTGLGFVVPPELARLRRKSLYKDLSMFICLEELDRSI